MAIVKLSNAAKVLSPCCGCLPNERKSGCHGTTLLTSGPIRRPTRQLELHSPWELDLFGQPQIVLVVVEAFRKVAHQKF